MIIIWKIYAAKLLRERETEGCQIHFPSFLSLSSPPQVLFLSCHAFKQQRLFLQIEKNLLRIFWTFLERYSLPTRFFFILTKEGPLRMGEAFFK